MRIWTDTLAEVHEGDTVRYVRWDYGTRGKFHNRTGTVTEVRSPGAVGVHFPHYPRGTNLIAVACDVRLVACVHEPEGDNRYPGQPALPGTTGISRHELREG